MRILILPALLVSSTLASALPEAEARGSSGKTIPIRESQSIQRAIESAPRGSRIIVEAGEYKEQLTIKTGGITLVGENGAILVPPDSSVENECMNFAGPNEDKTPSQAGICVAGEGLDLDTFVSEHVRVKSVQRPVRGVKVSGFTISGFFGINILFVGAEDTEISENKLLDSLKYGFLTAGSVNTRVSGNEVGSMQSGFIGLCMDNFSKVKVVGNKISNYFIGLCIQTNGAEVEDKQVSDACFGAFLDPDVRDVRLRRNHITNAFPNGCADFGTAAIGVNGAIGARVEDNFVEGWKTKDAQNTTSGIAVVDAIPAVARGNVVKGNTLRDNSLDIFVNTTGSGNEFRGNRCATSNKDGVCRLT